MKTESSDKEIKDLFGNIVEFYKGIGLLDTMLFKYNLDVFNKFYKDISQNMMNYYTNYSKALEKLANPNRTSVDNMHDSKDIIPASGHDICNYLTRYSMSNFQIQAIMKLDGRLDFDKMKRAVRLSVDVEPVFGCRFIEDDPPYWKRLDNIDEINFCSLEEADNSDEAVMRFLQSSLDMDNDPKVKVKILRSEQYDILAVKLNHACCDGAGAKEYIQLLSNIYSCIDQEDGTFIPEPQIGGRKDQDKLFKGLGVTCPELRWNPVLDIPKSSWTFPWKQRGGDSIRFAICRLPQGSLDSIYKYGKYREATVNDLILTAFYRTMFKISKPIYSVPMDISSTIDLRRYLPDHKTKAIRNLSGGFVTRIARIMNETFEGTLSRVANATKKIKDSRAGVNNSRDEEYVEKTSFTYFHDNFDRMSQTSEISAKFPNYIGNVCFPGLSNLGYISTSEIRFGENVVTDAYITPPAIRAPGFLLLASSYNGILTMSIGYYKDSISQKDMDGLLNMVKNELMRGCACEQ